MKKLLPFLLLALLVPQATLADTEHPEREVMWNEDPNNTRHERSSFTFDLNSDEQYVQFYFMFCDDYGNNDGLYDGVIEVINEGANITHQLGTFCSKGDGQEYDLTYDNSYSNTEKYGYLTFVEEFKDGHHHFARYRYYPGSEIVHNLNSWKFHITYYWDIDFNGKDDNEDGQGTKNISWTFARFKSSGQPVFSSDKTDNNYFEDQLQLTRKPWRYIDWYLPAHTYNKFSAGDETIMTIRTSDTKYGISNPQSFAETDISGNGNYDKKEGRCANIFAGYSMRKSMSINYFYEFERKDGSKYSTYVTPTGTIKLPGFPYPSNVQVRTSSMWDKTAQITWNRNSDTNADKSGRWYVYRARHSSPYSYTLLTPDGLPYDETTYTDVVPEVEYEYIYYVAYALPEWHLDRPEDDLHDKANYTLARNFLFSGMKATAHSKSTSTMHIEFSHDKVPANHKCEIRLYHLNDGMLLHTWTWDENTIDESTSKTFDHNTGSPARDVHRYRLEATLLDGTVQSSEFSGSVSGSNTMKSLEASLGDYANVVRLTWQADIKNSNIQTYYEISRRDLNSNTDFMPIGTMESTATLVSFEDSQAEPGSFYEYRVTQKTREDALNENGEVDSSVGQIEVQTGQLTTDGFSVATGYISGRVSFASGTGVPDVLINLEPDEDQEIPFYALTGKTSSSDYMASISDDKLGAIFDSHHFTIQMWVRLNSESSDATLAKVGIRQLNILKEEGGNSWFLNVGSTSEGAAHLLKLEKDRYYLVTMSQTGDNDFTLSVCGDGDGNIVSQNITTSSTSGDSHSDFSVGCRVGSEGSPFALIDEVRVWSRVLTEEEILKDSDHPLVGTENGLELYWPFDEGLKNLPRAYDYSKTGNINNGCHGIIANGAFTEAVVPNCFHLYGRTNENGSYSVRGISFSPNGTNYVVRPSKGTHSFTPSFETRYFSSTSLTHNSVNITDVSSFEVSGEAFYDSTRCPVVGAGLYVDGSLVYRNGQPVYTNADGKYTISVPIGDHYIEIKKDGHTFLNNGRYPAEAGTTFNFEKEIENLRFTDKTLVPVVGRVVGGSTEGNKPLGLGQSVANIGQAEITLEAGAGLNVLEKEEDLVTQIIGNTAQRNLPLASEYVNSTAYVVGNSEADQTNIIHIKTDPKTGEFAAMLPPLNYHVTNITIPSNPDIDLGVEASVLNATNASNLMTDSIVSLLNPTDLQMPNTFSYAAALRKVYHSEPVVRVVDTRNPHSQYGAFGMDSCRYVTMDGHQSAKRIPAYTVNTVTEEVTYAFGYPLLDFYNDTPNAYDIKIYEPYENRDNPDDIVYYEEPAKRSHITITNEFCSDQSVYLTGEQRGSLIDSICTSEIYTDSTGVAHYQFYTGLPNINGDNTLGMNIDFEIDGVTHSWDQNGLFKVIVLGDLTRGNNFTTKGPDQVSYVLRDPPGTASKATRQKGSTTTTTTEWSVPFTLGGDLEIAIGRGVGSTTWATGDVVGTAIGELSGLITLSVQETPEVKKGTTIDLHLFYHHTEGHTTVKEETTLESFSTSNNEDFVGANGDLFLGSSTNVTLGESTFLKIYEQSDGSLQLKTRDAEAAGVEYSTNFAYSQHYIENALLPQQQHSRDSLLITVSEEVYKNLSPKSADLDAPAYYTIYKPGDKEFGSLNNDSTIWGDSASVSFDSAPSYKMVLPATMQYDEHGDLITQYTDMVAFYNSSITNWKNILAQNEADKYNSIYHSKEYLEQNVSFASGASYSHSYTKSETNKDMYSNGFDFSGSFLIQLGGQTNGLNYFYLNFGIKPGATVEFSWEHTDENKDETAVIYDLEETDQYEAISVDVFKSEMGWGPIFFTRGGQTSGPWEDAVISKYYEPGLVLSQATQRVDDPWMQFDRYDATGVPVGQPARFKVKTRNQSPTGCERFFDFGLLHETDEFGATYSFAGSDHDLSLLIGPEEKEFELLVWQADESILDYNVEFVMTAASQTEQSIFGALKTVVPLTIHFAQSSSPVGLASSRNTVNSQTDSTVTFRVHDFDRSYRALKAIQLLYRYEGDEQYSIAQEWVCDESYTPTAPEAYYIDENTSNVSYLFDMHSKIDFPDGRYFFKARTLSGSLSELVSVDSEELEIVKDIEKPKVMGLPEPTNGILGPGDIVSLRYNEPLRPITDKDIKILVTGERNGATIAEGTALQLTAGNVAASTDATYQIADQDFTMELWMNISKGYGNLVQHGTDDNHFRVGIDSVGHLTVDIGNGSTVHRSDAAISFDHDTYLYYCYQQADGNPRFSATAFDANGTTTLFQNLSVAAYSGNGRLSLGGGQLTGRIHDLTLWNQARSADTSLAQRDYTKTAQTQGLIGYWRMNEGHGTQIRDYVQNRNFTAPSASWWIDTENYAAHFGEDSYLTMYSPGTIFFDEGNDYAMEFWMRSEGQESDAVLFASGTTQESVSPTGQESPEFKLVLSPQGALTISTAGKDESIITTGINLNDGAWHHLAMNVLRSGTTAFYIDGQLRRNLISEDIPSLRGRYITIGGQGFTGDMDEFRYWRASMAGDIIASRRYEQADTTGTDVNGLTLYLPFETQVRDEYNQVVTIFSTDDQSGNSTEGKNSGTKGYSQVAQAASAPGLKKAPVRENLNFEIVQSSDEIVIDLSKERPRDIEGQNVYITVASLHDLNDNLSDPVSFQVYVNQATLKWNTDRLDMEMDADKGVAKATVAFTNQSGKGTHWYVTNVPSWLSVSQVQGSIDPLKTSEIDITVAPGTPIGRYQDIIYLLGDDGIQQPLPVSLRVCGNRPDWAVADIVFPCNMALVARAVTNKRVCTNEETLVAAFNQEGLCVGLASPQYNARFDTYYVMMTIFGNAREQLTFSIWDADDGQVYPFTEVYLNQEKQESINFSSNAMIGTLQQPANIVATDASEQRLNLLAGWNWMSLCVMPDADHQTPEAIFTDKLGATAQVKYKNQFAQRSSSIWFNDDINPLLLLPGRMYKVLSSNAAEISIVGQTLKPSELPVDIISGYNWIGYNANFNASLADAFANLHPADGDVVRSKKAFAIYDNNEWVGTLTQLTPGEGYLYYNSTSESKSFHYPEATLQHNAPRQAPRMEVPTYYKPVDDSAYPGNMTLIARIEDGGVLVTDAELAVFVDGECRATSNRVIRGSLHFVTIPGQGSGQKLIFRVWMNEREYTFDPQLIYEDDAMIGTPDEPVVLDIQKGSTGIEAIYNGELTIENEVYDLQGRKLPSTSRRAPGIYIHQGEKGAHKVLIRNNKK